MAKTIHSEDVFAEYMATQISISDMKSVTTKMDSFDDPDKARETFEDFLREKFRKPTMKPHQIDNFEKSFIPALRRKSEFYAQRFPRAAQSKGGVQQVGGTYSYIEPLSIIEEKRKIQNVNKKIGSGRKTDTFRILNVLEQSEEVFTTPKQEKKFLIDIDKDIKKLSNLAKRGKVQNDEEEVKQIKNELGLLQQGLEEYAQNIERPVDIIKKEGSIQDKWNKINDVYKELGDKRRVSKGPFISMFRDKVIKEEDKEKTFKAIKKEYKEKGLPLDIFNRKTKGYKEALSNLMEVREDLPFNERKPWAEKRFINTFSARLENDEPNVLNPRIEFEERVAQDLYGDKYKQLSAEDYLNIKKTPNRELYNKYYIDESGEKIPLRLFGKIKKQILQDIEPSQYIRDAEQEFVSEQIKESLKTGMGVVLPKRELKRLLKG